MEVRTGTKEHVTTNYNQPNFGRISPTLPTNSSHNITVTADDDPIHGFTERDVRMSFIRKVYAILTIQIAMTTSIIAFVLFCEPVKHFIMTNNYFWWTCFGVSTTLLFSLVCITSVRRNLKVNLTLLIIFTVAISTLLAGITCYYETDVLFLAAGITVMVCLGLSLFALQTRWDFTKLSGSICVLLTILLMLLVVSLFVYSRILNLIYASLGVFVFSLYLVYDTQLMIGGKHKYSIAPDEYSLAALHLYLDILLVFMYLMQLIRFAMHH